MTKADFEKAPAWFQQVADWIWANMPGWEQERMYDESIAFNLRDGDLLDESYDRIVLVVCTLGLDDSDIENLIQQGNTPDDLVQLWLWTPGRGLFVENAKNPEAAIKILSITT